MLKIVPYKAAHLAMNEPRQYERELREKSGVDSSQTFMNGPAYTVLDDGTPVMAGGIVQLWPGVGEVWLFLSPWFERHIKTGYKLIREMFQALLKVYHFRRLQTPICASMPGNIRLVEHLGFHKEGLMELWGPDGKDYQLMALLSKEGAVCLRA